MGPASGTSGDLARARTDCRVELHIHNALNIQERSSHGTHSKTENPKQSNETPFWSRFGSKIESRLYFGRDFNSETGIDGFVSDFRFYWPVLTELASRSASTHAACRVGRVL